MTDTGRTGRKTSWAYDLNNSQQEYECPRGRNHSLTPEKALLRAVLLRAVLDYTGMKAQLDHDGLKPSVDNDSYGALGVRTRTTEAEYLKRRAEAWIWAELGDDEVMSFRWICATLDRDCDRLRREIDALARHCDTSGAAVHHSGRLKKS